MNIAVITAVTDMVSIYPFFAITTSVFLNSYASVTFSFAHVIISTTWTIKQMSLFGLTFLLHFFKLSPGNGFSKEIYKGGVGHFFSVGG